MTNGFRSQRAFAVASVAPLEGPVELPVIDLEPHKRNIAQPGQKDHYKFTVSKEGRHTIETEGALTLS